eukprot:403330811
MNIPQLDSCRFITLPQLKQRIANDNFSYKSCRILGKVKILQNEHGFTVIEQDDEEFVVNSFLVKDKNLEIHKIYEFLGEIEEHADGFVYMKARGCKAVENFNSKVYFETTSEINKLMEAMFTRTRAIPAKPQENVQKQQAADVEMMMDN